MFIDKFLLIVFVIWGDAVG